MKQLNDVAIECPCCNEIRRYGHLEHLRKWHVQHDNPGILSPIESAESGFLQWACDECIKKRKAIVGKPDRQNVIGITHPYLAYYDQQRTCSTCGIAFTFSKEEQQHWYEELKFVTWSDAKDCKDCRKTKRGEKERNKRIAELLQELQPEDLDRIEELVQLYLEIDHVEKAKYFLAITRKHVRKSEDAEVKAKWNRLREKILSHNQ